ncbi:PAS domain S-box protein, partial [Caldithrix abyssi]
MAEQLKQTTLRDYQTTITILEHLTDAIFILKPDGAIQYANRVACDLLGLPLSQILKNNLNDFLQPPFLFEENEKSFLEQIYQHSILELERTLKHGSYATPVVISFGFVRNNQDEVDFIIASARDVSVRKNLEKELYQQQLYAQSRDRYKELGELAINIVHRLSQPITSIRLLVEMMQKKLQRTG